MKRAIAVFVVASVGIALPVAAVRKGGAPDGDERGPSQSRIQRGIDIAPVELNVDGKNRAQVGLGSYLVNAAGGCNDCHTCPPYAPGHDPFEGGDGQINAENYLAGGTPFGPFVSRNLTPDENGLPAGLTLEEFVTTLRTGHDPHNPGSLLQVMPWPVYGNLTDHDLGAIYAFLSAIPHAEPGCQGD